MKKGYNAEVPISNTVQVQSLEDDDWGPFALFARSQQSQLCFSIVDPTIYLIKLKNNLAERLIVASTIAKYPYQLCLLIEGFDEINSLVCR